MGNKFKCVLASGSGSGATITVSYSSDFYNKTITCSDGTTTLTDTTTSSGSTTFNVADEGTWTITCNGVTTTVDVVLNYTKALAITKTITVYSAASDTLSFTDFAGSKTVTTDTSGTGTVSITYIPNQTITFTSSVAKEPTSLSTDYSKTVTMLEATTEVYVMPDNALYWYGYKSSNLEVMSSGNGWSRSGFTFSNPTDGTNKYTCTTTSSQGSKYVGYGSKNIVSNATKIHAIAQGVQVDGTNAGSFGMATSKTALASATATNFANTTLSHKEQTALSSGAIWLGIATGGNNRKIDCYALWYE